MNPWISVIIPTYNGSAYLRHSLQSIVEQHEPGIEVVAVDDGSSDDTLSILKDFQRQIPIELVLREHSGNWVIGTNVGLKAARAPHASVLHQDDIWLPERARAIRRAIGETPGATLLVHDSYFIDPKGRRVGRLRCPLAPGRNLTPSEVMERLLIQNFVAMPSAVFPTKQAIELGGLDEELWFTADWDLWLRLAAAGVTRYLAQPLCAYRVHPAALTATRSADSSDFRSQLETVSQRYMSRWVVNEPWGSEVSAAAAFSIEANVAFAAFSHRSPVDLPRLTRSFLRLGPKGLRRYMRSSRVLERLVPRLRARSF